LDASKRDVQNTVQIISQFKPFKVMKKLFIFCLGIFAIVSCKEKETMIPETLKANTINNVELVEGVLKFSSQDHLNKVVKGITDVKDMSAWYSKPGFISLFNRQESITQAQIDKIGSTGEIGTLSDILVFNGEGENKSLDKIVEDPRFAAILNSKGYVIVADTAYHIGAKRASQINISNDKSTLAQFLQNSDMKGVSYTNVVNEQIGNARIMDTTVPYGDKRRMIGEFKKHFAAVYQSLVVRVKYQKKNTFGWSECTTTYISFTASGTFSQGSLSGIPFSGSRSANNVDEQSMFVTESAGGVNSNWDTTFGTASCSDAGHLFNFTFTE
jgi:hypothetical protein